MTKQYKRIRDAKQLKPIYLECSDQPFPIGSNIVLDKKQVIDKKEHQIIWKTGNHFGNVGDRCASITHQELFDLYQQGFIDLVFC